MNMDDATPGLILISGWAHTSSDLEDLRKRINNAGKVWAVSTADLWNENHAKVTAPSPYAAGLKKMIAELGGRAFVAGWSLGGMIALETAIHWPELFAGLILISSTPKFCLGQGWPTGTPAGAIRAMLSELKRDPRSVFKAFFENVFALSKDAEVAIKGRIESASAMQPRELIYGLEYLRDADFSGAVKNLNLPALIIHGRRDAIIKIEAAHQLNRLLARSRLRVYDDYGHGLPCQNPRAVAGDITRFMEACAQKTPR